MQRSMIDEISIVIPTLNEANYLPRLLESIIQQTYIGRMQVIIVDGHSADKTVELARSFADRIPDLLVCTAKRNAGHQRNIGAQHAKYKYLLFLDADIVLSPNVLKDLTSKVRCKGPFIVTVMHTLQSMNIIDRLFYVAFAYVFISCTLMARIKPVIGDFIFTTLENHKRIGGFIEGAIIGEDSDYGFRSVKAGAKYHFYYRPMVIASARRARLTGRTRLLLLWIPAFFHVRKHGPIFPGEGYDYPFGHYDSQK
jgi:glycosyltransferase involved in cell wall biosynthesis